MARKINKLFKILTAGLICALASIFLFSGCTNKSADKYENPDSSEYGLYTNLSLSIDCGEGKVWATVKNTFTFMPSTVRVTVELYKSDTYAEDYTKMELAAENSVKDLDMGKTVTSEASTGGKQFYWQARVYYKIDEKDWQEQTTSIWLIKGNGSIVTTNATPPKEVNKEESGTFCLKNLIDGKPIKAHCEMPYLYEFDSDVALNDGSFMIGGWGTKDADIESEEEIIILYDLFNLVTFEFTKTPPLTISGYNVSFLFSSGDRIDIYIRDNGELGGVYFDGLNNNYKGFMSDINAVNFEEVCSYIENLIIKNEDLPEKFCLKEIIESEPSKAEYCYKYYPKRDEESLDEDGVSYIIGQDRIYSFDDKEKLKKCYALFSDMELQISDKSVFSGDEIHEILYSGLNIYFDNNIRIGFLIKNNGQLYCYYAKNCSGNYDILSNHKCFHRCFASQAGAVDIESIQKFIEELNIEE